MSGRGTSSAVCGEVGTAIERRALEVDKVYIVQGVSARVPGCVLSVHASQRGADERAAELVNILLRELRMRANATADTWARRVANLRARELGDDCEGESDVWVSLETVHDLPAND